MNDLSHMFICVHEIFFIYIATYTLLIIFVEKSQAAFDSISFTLTNGGNFSLKKMTSAASFTFKIGGRSQYLVTLLASVLGMYRISGSYPAHFSPSGIRLSGLLLGMYQIVILPDNRISC